LSDVPRFDEKEGRRVAGADRMTIEEVVRKVLLDEHADVIREAARAVAAELMELEVSELIGAQRGERPPGADSVQSSACSCAVPSGSRPPVLRAHRRI
jgi:hypothetical protein